LSLSRIKCSTKINQLSCAIGRPTSPNVLGTPRRVTVSATTVGILYTPGFRGVASHSDCFAGASGPAGEDVASPDEYETGCSTRAPSARSGPVLWPKKLKTQKTNAVVRENLSRSFDSFTACLLCWTAFPTIKPGATSRLTARGVWGVKVYRATFCARGTMSHDARRLHRRQPSDFDLQPMRGTAGAACRAFLPTSRRPDQCRCSARASKTCTRNRAVYRMQMPDCRK
jgi:hypothetical protein